MTTKLERLQDLSEAELREVVLIPLLVRMGFRGPTLYHGQREYGKDITAFDIDRLGRRWYLGVVAKTGDLTGAVSGSRSLREIVYQVEQCFNIPYRDLYGMLEVTMDKVWICTSGEIVPGAADSVFDTLRKQNLDKLVRVIRGKKMVELLDEFYPTFWDEEDSLDAVRSQRDRAFDLIRRILGSLGTTSRDIARILDTLGGRSNLPKVSLEGSSHVVRASPYNIELEETDSSISPVFSHQCGWIREQYLRTRQKVSDALMDVEEVIYNYDRVAKTKSPESFLEEFDRLLAGERPFFRAQYGAASEAVSAVNYLTDGLQDVRVFERALEANNLLAWSRRAFRSILDSKELLEPVLSSAKDGELVVFWTEHDEDPVLRPEFGEPVDREARFVTRSSIFEEYRPRFGKDKKKRRIDSDKVIAAAGSALRRQLEEEIDFDWVDWEE